VSSDAASHFDPSYPGAIGGLFNAHDETLIVPKLDGIPIQQMFGPDDCIFVIGADECAETYEVSVVADRASSIAVHTAFLPKSSAPVCWPANVPPGNFAHLHWMPDNPGFAAAIRTRVRVPRWALGRRADRSARGLGITNIATRWRTVERSFNYDVRAFGAGCACKAGCQNNGYPRHTAPVPSDALRESTVQQPHSNGRECRQEDR
jgi:hypothetical protein